ncbi:NepR family anti-sigma factor [Pararhizobium mangrovi]|uniref:Anti-sigma factor NepR domain-containing protein n=1 Tax=Pararhizobium mangrovi TaxID=2590452 RepID=A0A506U292_9HYPH|nr:NepR family anti-sigma factor [Pararhizobium mangrovi]TPW26689.1 hypothetical protein FJU11_13885 [Pararhizobium mangrovi]
MNDKPDENARDSALDTPHIPLDPNSEIGSRLKAFYSAVQEEPIPDRFLDLLQKLDESEQNSQSGSSRQGQE